jgi:chromate transporter
VTASDPVRIPASAPGAILARFLRFGLFAWGGPVAQIAMLRHELVEQEHWMSSERFNRLLAVYQVLPGPEAHELAVHMGLVRGGRLGALLAGLGFMLPGFLLMLLLSWLYLRVDLTQPALAAALLGAQITVVALVTRAVPRIGRHILVDTWTWAIAVAAAIATLGGLRFWVVLPLSALAYVLAPRRARGDGGGFTAAAVVIVMLAVAALTAWATNAAQAPGPSPATGPGGTPDAIALLGSGLKAGLLTFGGAYTAIPFVRQDAVGSGWLTEGQFLDGLALGGVLPAPLIIFGTFVGFVADGLPGALAMTLGIFLPAFSFALLFGDRLEALVDSRPLHRALEGVAAGVVGIIAVTAIQLGVAVAGRVPSLAIGAAIFVVGLVILFRWPSRWATPLVVGTGAVAGWLLLGGAAAAGA